MPGMGARIPVRSEEGIGNGVGGEEQRHVMAKREIAKWEMKGA